MEFIFQKDKYGINNFKEGIYTTFFKEGIQNFIYLKGSMRE